MQDIGQILLAGAGAIGMLHAVPLFDYAGVSFRLVADAARRARYERDGLFFNGRRMDFVFAGSGDPFPADLVLVATKFPGYGDALEEIAPFVREKTILLPLLNGVSAADLAAERFPQAHVLSGFFLGHASRRQGNCVFHDGVGKTCIGERGDAGPTDALRAVAELFRRAKIHAETPRDMTAAMWKKFILNVGVNQASAYFRADYGTLRSSPEKLDFTEKLMLEALAVARAEKIPVGREAVDDALKIIVSMPPDAKTSMLQDVESNRQTEVALFAGEIRKRAARYGIPTPANDEIFARFGGD